MTESGNTRQSGESGLRYAFFLGGRDLEMATIAELLATQAPQALVYDKQLAWGARLSSYAVELERTQAQSRTPVLVELTLDQAVPVGAVIIDHHNDRAGACAPTSLEQVFQLLKLPAERWTRWHALVAANDRGYLPGMSAIGASQAEMLEIRQADRSCQGITIEEEAIAKAAIVARVLLADGKLSVVTIAHDRMSAVTDHMEPLLGGPGYQNLLVATPHEVSFYGSGSIILGLKESFPESWCGGSLPDYGYWGAEVSAEVVLPALKSLI